MFLVRGIDGGQRAFTAGDFRNRKGIAAVEKVAPIAHPEASEEAGHHERHSQRELSIARYQNKGAPALPEEVRLASEIMTFPVVTVVPTSTIRDVERMFTERRFRHIPITGENGALVGLISDRDVLRFRATSRVSDAVLDTTPIKQIMVSHVLIATADTPIREIAQVMFEERIGSIPIVNGDGSPIGIITRSDILRAIIKHGPMRIWA